MYMYMCLCMHACDQIELSTLYNNDVMKHICIVHSKYNTIYIVGVVEGWVQSRYTCFLQESAQQN